MEGKSSAESFSPRQQTLKPILGTSTPHKPARNGDAKTRHAGTSGTKKARTDLATLRTRVSQIGRTSSNLSQLSHLTSRIAKQTGFKTKIAHDKSLLVRLGLRFMPKYEKSFQSLRLKFRPSPFASGLFIMVWVVTHFVFFSLPAWDKLVTSVAVAAMCISATLLLMHKTLLVEAKRSGDGFRYFEEIVVLLVLSFAIVLCASDPCAPRIPFGRQEPASNEFSSAHLVVLVVFEAHVHFWRLNPLYTFLVTHAFVVIFALFHFKEHVDWTILWSLEIVASYVSVDAALWENQLRQLFRPEDEPSDHRVPERPGEVRVAALSAGSASDNASDSRDVVSFEASVPNSYELLGSPRIISPRKSSFLTRSKKNEFYDTLQGIHDRLDIVADMMNESKAESPASASPNMKLLRRQIVDQVVGLMTSTAYWGTWEDDAVHHSPAMPDEDCCSRVTDYWRTIIQPEPKPAGKLTVITHPTAEHLRVRQRRLTLKRIWKEAEEGNGQLHRIGEWGLDALLLEQETHGALRLVCDFFMDAHWFPFLNVTEMQDLCVDIESHYLPERHFHNSSHAADVTNSFYCLGVTVTGVWGQLSKERVCACILAAAAHDVGHPGRTNPVLINSLSDLALRYNDRSVLENMHASILFKLMRNREKALDLDLEAYKRFKWFCVTLILATDTEVYFEEVNQMRALVGNTSGKHWDFESMTEKELLVVVKHCIRASDVSHTARDFTVHWQWSHAIQKEYDEQAAEERQLGLPTSPTSQSPLIPGQISFFQYIVLPVWELLAKLSKPVYSFVPYTVITTACRQRGLLHREASEEPLVGCKELQNLDNSIDEKVLFKRVKLNMFIWKQIIAGVVPENGPYPTEIQEEEEPVPSEQMS